MEEMTKTFKNIPKVLYFPLFLLSLTVLLTILKAHGSSMGMYDLYFFGHNVSGPILGVPRAIRSDEYLIRTTRIIAQAQVGYPEVNPLFGTGINFSLVGLPIRNWTTLFRPQYWGFFLLPVDYAFSWMWWSRGAIFIISFYLIMLWVTKKNITASALLAIAFFFAPFVQWWYSTSLLEILSFGVLLLLVFIRLLQAANLKQAIISAIIFSYLSICFAVIAYPPFQLPVVYAMFFLGVGYLLETPNLITKIKMKQILPVLVLSLLVVAGVLFLWFFSFKDIVDIVMQTVYPGKRRVTGGNFSLLYLIGGFFDILFLSDSNGVPHAIGSNQSEAASFLMLSIFILPIILFGEVKAFFRKNQKQDWIAVFASAYFILFLVWGFEGLPSSLAHISFLTFVPSRRAMIGFGLIDIFIIAYFLFRYKRIFNKEDLYIFASLYAIFIFVIYVDIGRDLRRSAPQFIQRVAYIFFIAAIVSILLYFLLIRHRKVFLGLFLFVSLGYTFFVNPISFGLSPILDSEFSSAIQEVKERAPTEAKWVIFDSLQLGNYLVANGVPALNVPYPYPDMGLWSEFDPKNKFEDIYNRQSHVIFIRGDADDAKFNLIQKGVFTVQISPCSPTFRQVGVEFYVFIEPVSYSCLQRVATVNFPKMPLYIYELVETY